MEEPRILKNRPTSSAFKQQTLAAWQPILTADTVLPTFFLIGILFMPIGVGLLLSSNQVQEKIIDYTQCTASNSNTTCANIIARNTSTYCICEVKFNLGEDFSRDVYIYYSLTNFYQNHRRYVKSRDDSQLYGSKSISQDCEPFAYRVVNGHNMPIAPCGAIPNSMFNDTFRIYEVNESHNKNSLLSSGERLIDLLKTGIAWATDKSSKFRNPVGTSLKDAFKEYTNPPNWRNKQVWQLDEHNVNNNGYLNEAFIIWMRTAAFPSFRKLYTRINHASSSNYHVSLPKGTYKLKIEYNYPVASFGGTKRIIISNTSWLGGKNSFLGITYIMIGMVCLILSAVFLLIHKKFGKSKTDMIAVTSKTPYLEPSN